MGAEKRNGVVITEAGNKWSNLEYFQLTGIREYVPYMFGGGCVATCPPPPPTPPRLLSAEIPSTATSSHPVARWRPLLNGCAYLPPSNLREAGRARVALASWNGLPCVRRAGLAPAFCGAP